MDIVMLLWVGLGNPGKKYENQRHNIGFMCVDRIAAEYSFSPWREKMSAYICEGKIAGQKILLVKPQSFMNKSGGPVTQIAHFFKIPTNSIYVFHDDIDLKSGQLKIKNGGGHGGHNGLRDIDAHMNKDYWRIRMGIGRPMDKAQVHNWVLGNFTADDTNNWLEPLLKAIILEIALLADGNTERFMSRVAWRAPLPIEQTIEKS